MVNGDVCISSYTKREMYQHENINLNNNNHWRIFKFSIPKKIFAKTFKSQGYLYNLFYKVIWLLVISLVRQIDGNTLK